MSEFVIHALRAGGGMLALSRMPGRGGDYSADLGRIIDWRADAVLTMTTSGELAQNGAKDFGIELAAQGCRWLHLPVDDFGTPAATIEAKWPAVSEEIRQVLASGGRVLVHCYGGCGRSGMAVLRLMIEAGEAADLALARLRDLRPCAVETPAQLAWAMR